MSVARRRFSLPSPECGPMGPHHHMTSWTVVAAWKLALMTQHVRGVFWASDCRSPRLVRHLHPPMWAHLLFKSMRAPWAQTPSRIDERSHRMATTTWTEFGASGGKAVPHGLCRHKGFRRPVGPPETTCRKRALFNARHGALRQIQLGEPQASPARRDGIWRRMRQCSSGLSLDLTRALAPLCCVCVCAPNPLLLH